MPAAGPMTSAAVTVPVTTPLARTGRLAAATAQERDDAAVHVGSGEVDVGEERVLREVADDQAVVDGDAR